MSLVDGSTRWPKPVQSLFILTLCTLQPPSRPSVRYLPPGTWTIHYSPLFSRRSVCPTLWDPPGARSNWLTGATTTQEQTDRETSRAEHSASWFFVCGLNEPATRRTEKIRRQESFCVCANQQPFVIEIPLHPCSWAPESALKHPPPFFVAPPPSVVVGLVAAFSTSSLLKQPSCQF